MRPIDGDALIDKYGEWYVEELTEIVGYIGTIKRIVDSMPTIELERKKGKWIGTDSQCGIGCPFCGTPVDDFCNSIDYIDLNYEPNFCPNCGADLRQKEDENV